MTDSLLIGTLFSSTAVMTQNRSSNRRAPCTFGIRMEDVGMGRLMYNEMTRVWTIRSIWDIYSEFYAWIDPEESENDDEDEDEDDL